MFCAVRVRLAALGLVATVVLPFVSAAEAQSPPAQSQPTVVHVKQMHCEGCAKKLRTELYRLPHVVKVVTDVKKNRAVVTIASGKSVPLADMWRAADKAKLGVAKIVGPQGTLDQPPAKKRAAAADGRSASRAAWRMLNSAPGASPWRIACGQPGRQA